MKTIKKHYTIKGSIDKVYQAFIDKTVIEKWSGSSAIMDASANGKFSLWEGSIHGVNKEVTKNKIVQDWQEDNWDKPSKVTFNITKDGENTIVELTHENIPDESAKSIDNGWDEYYLGPLKELVENNNT